MTTDFSPLIAVLDRQQNQLDNIEKQLGKLADVMLRITLLEERRTYDQQSVAKMVSDVDHVKKEVDHLKGIQDAKHPQYDEMLESYKQFKKAVITFICSGLLGAVVLVSSGMVKVGH